MEECRRIVPRLEDLVAARMIKQFEDASLEIPACLLPVPPRQGPRGSEEGYDAKTAAASWQCRFFGGISNRQEEQLELLPKKLPSYAANSKHLAFLTRAMRSSVPTHRLLL